MSDNNHGDEIDRSRLVFYQALSELRPPPGIESSHPRARLRQGLGEGVQNDLSEQMEQVAV